MWTLDDWGSRLDYTNIAVAQGTRVNVTSAYVVCAGARADALYNAYQELGDRVG
jgi:hypothetical protein